MSDKSTDEENKIRKALFGNGTFAGGLISQVHIGGQTYQKKINGVLQFHTTGPQAGQPKMVRQNSYTNIREVLKKFEFDGTNVTPIVDHQNHYHIYLRPPVRQEIISTQMLTADDSGNTLDISQPLADPLALGAHALTQSNFAQPTVEIGEEIMFTMEIPYVPVYEAPITVVQAANGSAGEAVQGAAVLAVASTKPDYIFTDCYQIGQDVPSYSAIRSIDPAGRLTNEFLRHLNERQVETASKSTRILEGPKHGKLSTEVADNGYQFFAYFPNPGYIGKDRVVFLVEVDGKRYKVVTTLLVVKNFEYRDDPCPLPDIHYGSGRSRPSAQGNGMDIETTSTTALASWLRVAQLDHCCPVKS